MLLGTLGLCGLWRIRLRGRVEGGWRGGLRRAKRGAASLDVLEFCDDDTLGGEGIVVPVVDQKVLKHCTSSRFFCVVIQRGAQLFDAGSAGRRNGQLSKLLGGAVERHGQVHTAGASCASYFILENSAAMNKSFLRRCGLTCWLTACEGGWRGLLS